MSAPLLSVGAKVTSFSSAGRIEHVTKIVRVTARVAEDERGERWHNATGHQWGSGPSWTPRYVELHKPEHDDLLRQARLSSQVRSRAASVTLQLVDGLLAQEGGEAALAKLNAALEAAISMARGVKV